jgi:hypothetical protein
MRDAGRLMRPQPHALKKQVRTSTHSGGTGKPGNPARDGLRCMPRSLGEMLYCARRPTDEGFVRPGWAGESHRVFPKRRRLERGVGAQGSCFVPRFSSVPA